MKRAERAMQVWQVLLSLAYNRQTLTYNNLSKIIGMESNIPDAVKHYLEVITKYCKNNSLLPLSALIVNQKTGLPDISIISGKVDFNKTRESIYKYPWYKIKPIKLTDLEKYS